jgi:hypothetical protein
MQNVSTMHVYMPLVHSGTKEHILNSWEKDSATESVLINLEMGIWREE